MKVLFMTNEFPPHVYGGAGVHVEYLSKEMARIAEVEVRSFHDQNEELAGGRLKVRGNKLSGQEFDGCPKEFVSPLKALSTGLLWNGQGIEADVVHCHTWYAHFGGLVAKQLYSVPLVITVHSLEPLRPWKREQLGHGYDLSSWVERTALETADKIIAVSGSTRDDIVRLFPTVDPNKIEIVYNGIDIHEYSPGGDVDVLHNYGIAPEKPFVLFVGRMTRQKGLLYLLKAAHELNPDIQLVLCAGDADTPEMRRELEDMVAELREARGGVVWIPEMLPRATVIQLYAQAAVFCCPSIYEPFGIINLEAMACATPVVGSAVGGIKEVVIHGETGLLVDPEISDTAPHDPRDPEEFAHKLAEAINLVAGDPERAGAMGRAGRRRVEDVFSWEGIARRTLELYQGLL